MGLLPTEPSGKRWTRTKVREEELKDGGRGPDYESCR